MTIETTSVPDWIDMDKLATPEMRAEIAASPQYGKVLAVRADASNWTAKGPTPSRPSAPDKPDD